MSRPDIGELQTIVTAWSGPFKRKDFADKQSEASSFDDGLYLLAGRQQGHQYSILLYCGITERLYAERFYKHKKFDELEETCPDGVEVWIGKVECPANFDRSVLLRAEKLLIYSWV